MTSTETVARRWVEHGQLAGDFAKFLVKHVVIRRMGGAVLGLR